MQPQNLQATGIVAEYNPFHNGHLYHAQKAKELTGQPVIAVMSGSFMQRGEPACLNKWQRAALACANGVDLVLELPCAFSLRSAQYFAQGAVQALKATGCVSALACGAETASRDFAALARRLSSSDTQSQIKRLIQKGSGYAAACSQALGDISQPNDILALEYCKALQGTDIVPLFLQRLDAGYNSTEISGSMASATAIRRSLSQGDGSWRQAVPENVRAALASARPGYDRRLFWQLLSYRLRLLAPSQIAERCQCGEGLENLLKQAADCSSLDDALRRCVNKRYSASRIRRLFCQLLLDKPRSFWEQPQPAYLRVLAFNDTGRLLLKTMKQTALLPLITKLGHAPTQNRSEAFVRQLELDLAATDLWSLVQYDDSLNRTGNDFLLSPRYVKI
ncbi:MAG: nucleotidyltransferase family protein [Phascolarctobacterium sp.]|uniref:tRNA(Met) cytidine acetate ligase n=1 Tax=Phascolarctobacterium sp. TaxID=2049039 RepID=UPI0026DD4F4D|nr:nucleotidyltransferase family protein [Phascolarctobacterium sp.]MDO4920777.1 nucleotidyltransferase family protein [Phascolarctobacterium sp.]